MTINPVEEKFLKAVFTVLNNPINDDKFNSSTFFSPFYTLSLMGSIIVYTPSRDTNSEKKNHANYKDKKCRLWRKRNTFPSVSSLLSCAFSMFRRKMYELFTSETDIKRLIAATTQKIFLQTKDQRFPNFGKILIYSKDYRKNTRELWLHAKMYIWSHSASFEKLYTVLFVIFTMKFLNASVFFCSTACSSAAIRVRMRDY